jgi:serpin B
LSSRLPLWLAKLSTENVRVSLPKFKLEFTAELSEALESLGMKSAFSTEANFSGINRKNPACISKVFHKTFIDVGEEGTEAAAATAVIMPPAAAPHPEIPKEQIFNADHPFLYLIRHDASGCILFIGRVTDPRI